MIDPETAAEAKDVLDDVLDQRRLGEEWAQVDEEMRQLEQAIEAGDDDGARKAVERLGKRTLKLGPAGGISPQAVEPSEDTVVIRNRIVDSLA